MKRLQTILMLTALFAGICNAYEAGRNAVVADSLTHAPLPSASIFNRKGNFIGTTGSKGTLGNVSSSDYPITVRYMGYKERSIPYGCTDTIFLAEIASELPEVLVEAKQKKMLHILAYVREYSSLSSYFDTITMFREKMVDFMLPIEKKSRYRGWRYPRVLGTKSYYHFTNARGLDSVSDKCSHYYTWSDWIGMIPATPMPDAIAKRVNGTDTAYGKYSPTEIWVKKGDRVSLDINVMADTTSRKWVPNISNFFRKEDTEFEQIRLRLNYDNVLGNEVKPLDLTGYSFNIESRGRGRGMFQFGRFDQPFFVTTYAEVYILDKEFISVKDAKKWEKHKFPTEETVILQPAEAPELSPATLALIERVDNIDMNQVRLDSKPDKRLKNPNYGKRNDGLGQRMWNMFKQLTGISFFKSERGMKRSWETFRERCRDMNEGMDSIPYQNLN